MYEVEWLLDSNRRYVALYIAKYNIHIMHLYIVRPLAALVSA